MKRRPIQLAVLVALLLLLIAVGTAALLANHGVARPVVLTVFVGSATVERAGAAAQPAHSGDGIGDDDAVATSADGKASLSYPDGSITRLDSSTRVVVHFTQNGIDSRTSLQQSAGLTWNTVRRLLGGSSFEVKGPNSAVAEVRGTRFGYYVEHDASGKPVVWIDVYDGTVGVKGAIGSQVLAGPGQRVTVRAQAAPTIPAPIPSADLHLSFTVFNQTIEAVRGKPIAFASGTLSARTPGASTSVQFDGTGDLELVVGWPADGGDAFSVTVLRPDGSVYTNVQSTSPPLILTVPRAVKGAWTVTVLDLQSPPNEPWWMIVGRG